MKRSDAAGRVVVGAHRQQHVAGLGHARRARRAGRALRCRAASSSSSSESPSQPGKEKCALPGSRLGRVGVAVQHGVGHALAHGADQASRAARRPAPPAALGRRAVDRRRPTANAGDRRRRPACRSGRRAPGRRRAAAAPADAAARRATRAPTPTGPPSLCAATRQRVGARGRRSRRAACPTACTASVCNGHARARGAGAATSATGWTVPTSLFAHITVTSGDRAGVARDSSRSARRDRRARARSTGSQLDLGALVRRRATATASSTAWCSTALARIAATAAGPRPARPVQPLDREVVRLGAAGGEDDLAGSGSRGPRPRAPRGTPRPRGARDGPRRAATSVADLARAPRPWPRRPAAASAWSPRGRGRQTSPGV